MVGRVRLTSSPCLLCQHIPNMLAYMKWTVLISLATLLATIIGLTMIFEEKLIFFPSKYPDGMTDSVYRAADEDHLPVAVQNVWLTGQDGTRIHSWYLAPREQRPGKDHPVVVWFHGNAGNIAGWYPEFKAVVDLGADVLAVEYRGYGRSAGTPDETGVYQDAMAAWKYLTEEREIPSSRIIIYGFSLGGGVAVELAHRVEPAGLIVQSSFTSVPDMAAALMKFVPRFLVRTQMDSFSKIRSVTCPKLFIHSPQDDLVPYRLGKRLFEHAEEPKDLYEVSGADHNATFTAGGEALQARLKRFFETAVP